MNNHLIGNRIVEHGNRLFNAPKPETVTFTGDIKADELLNDFQQHPHAFLLACIMDQQIKYEKAWLIPYQIQKKLGSFSMATLQALTKTDMKTLMSKPQPLHRFVERMTIFFLSAIQRVVTQYHGDASRIWAGRPSSAEVVFRFLEFDGVGPKIASMAANILARDFKVPLADYYSIDVSADVHVRRVFWRLGLVAEEPTVEQVIYRARSLNPAFPGLMDFPTWKIGRQWCRPKTPDCANCYMKDLCPSATNRGCHDARKSNDNT